MPFDFRVNNFKSRFLNMSVLIVLSVGVFCINPFLQNFAKAESVINTEEKKWEHHVSVSSIFEAKFPQKYKYKIFPFAINEKEVAFSVELLSSIDGNLETKNKNIVIRATHTFGKKIEYWRAKKLLEEEAEKYVYSANKINGSIMVNESIDHQSFPGRDLYITYQKGVKKYGIRIRIYMTDSAKVEQVFTSTANNLFSFKANDFFDSIKLFDGKTKLENPLAFATGWENYVSKNKVFEVKLPPINSDYTPNLPVFKSTSNIEVMRYVIHDPVVHETVFYNIYSYKLKKEVDYHLVKRILFSKHVQKYVDNATIDAMETQSKVAQDYKIMSIRLIIPSPKNRPYLSTLLLEARYADDVVVVQEILSSSGHAASRLPSLLLENMKFYPDRYTKSPVKESPEATKKK